MKIIDYYRAYPMIRRLQSYITHEDRILDIGTGAGVVCKLLKDSHYQITPLDVVDKSIEEDIQPILYDGNIFPFKTKQFNASLMLYILHHTPDPAKIIQEAMRTSNKILIMEDIYDNPWRQYATYALDSIVNNEFIGHPHNNKTDHEWRTLFQELGLTLQYAEYYSSRLLVFKHAFYYLIPNN